MRQYAYKQSEVLGFVGCRVTSKLLGIGPSKRAWKDYKRINRKQRSRLDSDRSEMQSILYGSARMERNKALGVNKFYDWADIDCDMGLEDFDHVDHDTTQHQVHVFKAWNENWEEEAVKNKDPVQERMLMEKYKKCASLRMKTNMFMPSMTKTWSSRGKLPG